MHAPFTGKTPKADPYNYCVTVKVSAENNLGGALSTFDAASLSLEDNSRPFVTETATFSEATRGWRVRGHGRIHVEAGKVATVGKTLTYADDGTDAGHLSKEGAGTLVLGGRAVLDGDLAKTLEVASVFDDTLERVTEPGVSTVDKCVSLYEYRKSGRHPLFVFWDHGLTGQRRTLVKLDDGAGRPLSQWGVWRQRAGRRGTVLRSAANN